MLSKGMVCHRRPVVAIEHCRRSKAVFPVKRFKATAAVKADLKAY